MDFKLTEEQLMMRQMVRDFAQKELKPRSRELDAKQDPQECFSWELVNKASALGLRTLAIPAEYGGGGADLLTQVVVMEELGAGDLGFATMFGQHSIYAYSLGTLLNEPQRKEFLPQIIEDGTYFFSTAITEPNAGSDNLLPYDAPGAGMQTFARRERDKYVINGTKHFISNGGVAKSCFLYARTNKDLELTKSMSLFLVPYGTPGFSVARWHDKLGRRLLSNTELVFEDMRIPARYLLGNENEACLLASRLPGTINATACLLGCLRTCYEESLEYAKTRVQGGRPIIGHPTIGNKLSEMLVKIEAVRLLVWRNAWRWDNKYEYNPKMNYLTKAFADEVALMVVNDMIEIFGGIATGDKSLPAEKYLRDIYTTLHAFTNQHLALTIGTPT